VGTGLTFLGRGCSTRQELYFQLLFILKSPLSFVEILIPEANFSSSYKTKTNSFRRWPIAEEDEAFDFLLKTGPKTQKLPVEPKQAVTKSNRAYAVCSHSTAC
jgi:hypothetical protein